MSGSTLAERPLGEWRRAASRLSERHLHGYGPAREAKPSRSHPCRRVLPAAGPGGQLSVATHRYLL